MAARQPFNGTGTTLAPTEGQHSPWHSPVPYLFGGLAAMLGLIAFALLILACSYWKLSGFLENQTEGEGERGLEAVQGGRGKSSDSDSKEVVLEEKILVIMAGQVKPTHLATPMFSRSSSFVDNSSSCSSEKSCSCSKKSGNGDGLEMVKPQGGVTSSVSEEGGISIQAHEPSIEENH